MYFPNEIKNIIKNQQYKNEQIGMSTSSVMIFDTFVLKRNKIQAYPSHEVPIYTFLEGKINVPQLIYHTTKKKYEYLILSKIEGKMLLDPYFIEHPYQGIDLLIKGLKILWEIPIIDCPINFSISNKLAEAKIRLTTGHYEIDPIHFKDPRFPDEKAIYKWLCDHQVEEELVFTHGDYCLPNIIVDNEQKIGFIDMDRAGIACKWQDIALCVRSMNYNYGEKEEFINYFFEKLDIKKDDNKLEYYQLLDEFF